MIAVNGVAVTNQDVYIRGKKVQSMFIQGKKTYETMSAYARLLLKASKINRDLHTAATVAVFDSAYAAAQSAVGGDEPTQQTAYNNLQNAINALVGATFTVNITSLNFGAVGRTRDLMNYITYDGIAEIKFTTTNSSIVSLDGSIATRNAGGIVVITVSVSGFTPKVITSAG